MSDSNPTPTAREAQTVDGSGLRRAAMARAHSSSIRRSGVYLQKLIHYCIILSLSTALFIAVVFFGINNDYIIYPAIGTFALIFLGSTDWFARAIFKFMGQISGPQVGKGQVTQ